MYYIFFIHSSAEGHLSCLHVLAIVNSAAMNIMVHVYFQIMIFSGYMPRTRIAGSYGCSIFRDFFKNLCLFFARPPSLRYPTYPPGMNLSPRQQKCRVLTTGLPGNSLYLVF